MNGSLAANEALLGALATGLGELSACQVAVCVPAAYLSQVWAIKQKLGKLSGLDLGAQDVSAHPVGAHTGEVSAAMLIDLGCRFCLVGHSERRQ